LAVERAKSSGDGRSNPEDSFFHAWTKKRNPKLAANKQARLAFRRWTAGVSFAIQVHLLHGSRGVVHDAASAGNLTIRLHLRVERTPWRRWMCVFVVAAYQPVRFRPIRKSTCRPIVRPTGRNVRCITVALSLPVAVPDTDKLDALQLLDQFRQWRSLDDQRFCLVCGQIITGRQIEVSVARRGNGGLRASCPTERCNSIPMDWVLPTDEILSRVERAADEERRNIAMPPPVIAAGRNIAMSPPVIAAVHASAAPEKQPDTEFASWWRKLGLRLRRS
jgi:hypothetical protein